MGSYEVQPVGWIESPLTDVTAAPRQGDEGAPDVWIVVRPELAAALHGLEPGAEVIVVTWLHLARRDVLAVHPRDDPARPLTGVFATRSADRPNPIGLHQARVLAVEGCRVRIGGCEAVDGTPVLDLKPVWARPRRADRRDARTQVPHARGPASETEAGPRRDRNQTARTRSPAGPCGPARSRTRRAGPPRGCGSRRR